MHPKYKNVVLKMSGEALANSNRFGLDFDKIEAICQEIKYCVDKGVSISIVVGGGNFWRGREGVHMERTRADYMGMLATSINALALQDCLERIGLETRMQTSIEMRQIAEFYIRGRALNHLKKGRVVIFACGTGSPFFSTDTAAALRAAEVNADVILLAKNIDGVYDDDPRQNCNAQKFDSISYLDVIKKKLGVMDLTAISLCMDNRIPIIVFPLKNRGSIIEAVNGEKIGTIIS